MVHGCFGFGVQVEVVGDPKANQPVLPPDSACSFLC